MAVTMMMMMLTIMVMMLLAAAVFASGNLKKKDRLTLTTLSMHAYSDNKGTASQTIQIQFSAT